MIKEKKNIFQNSNKSKEKSNKSNYLLIKAEAKKTGLKTTTTKIY